MEPHSATRAGFCLTGPFSPSMGTGLSVLPPLPSLPQSGGMWILSRACGQGRLLLRRQNPRRPQPFATANRALPVSIACTFLRIPPRRRPRRPIGFFSPDGCPATRAVGRESRPGIPGAFIPGRRHCFSFKRDPPPFEGSSERLTALIHRAARRP